MDGEVYAAYGTEYFMDLRFPLALRLRVRECYDPKHFYKRWDKFCIVPPCSPLEQLEDRSHSPRVERLDDVQSQHVSVHGEGGIRNERVPQEETVTDQIGSLIISTNAADPSHVADPVGKRIDISNVAR